eukprot:725363-Amphidinium_carterae.1
MMPIHTLLQWTMRAPSPSATLSQRQFVSHALPQNKKAGKVGLVLFLLCCSDKVVAVIFLLPVL